MTNPIKLGLVDNKAERIAEISAKYSNDVLLAMAQMRAIESDDKAKPVEERLQSATAAIAILIALAERGIRNAASAD